jgi:2,3-dihydroxybiphenyl 1,2-dioxygenase
VDIRALAYVGVNSRDPKGWATWAPKVFGFSMEDPVPTVASLDRAAEMPDDGSVYLRMDDRRWRYAIHPGEREGELAYLGWELRDRLAFFEAVDELKNANIEVRIADDELALQRGVQGMAWFLDPVGYRHEICYAGYFFEDSFRPAQILQQGFRTGRLGIGHAVLMVPELTDELDEFATRMLGMRVFAGGPSIPLPGGDGGRVRTEMYRGSSNRRSHNLVYMEKPGYFGLHHLFFEYNTLDDLGRAYDRVQASEHPLIMRIGRHQADTYLSFYCRTPSLFAFEVGWNSMLIDEDSFVQERPLHSFAWGLDFVGDIILDHLKIEQPAG